MEIRARYVLVGFFTLAVVVGGFAFVYWLQNTGGIGKRKSFDIHFSNTVSGLLRGSPVSVQRHPRGRGNWPAARPG